MNGISQIEKDRVSSGWEFHTHTAHTEVRVSIIIVVFKLIRSSTKSTLMIYHGLPQIVSRLGTLLRPWTLPTIPEEIWSFYSTVFVLRWTHTREATSFLCYPFLEYSRPISLMSVSYFLHEYLIIGSATLVNGSEGPELFSVTMNLASGFALFRITSSSRSDGNLREISSAIFSSLRSLLHATLILSRIHAVIRDFSLHFFLRRQNHSTHREARQCCGSSRLETLVV